MVMQVAAGGFAELPQPLLADDVQFVQFRLATDRLSDTELLDSGHASAGRLVAELWRRLPRLLPPAASYLALNPRLALSADERRAVLATARRLGRAGDQPPCSVLTDAKQQVPVAYLLAADRLELAPPAHLGLLSSDDVTLDERFLALTYGGCQVVAVPGLGPQLAPQLDFFSTVSPALREFTRRAIARLAAAPDDAARQQLVQHGERLALLGFHAGDVLFLLQALALEKTPFTGVIVPVGYADIVAKLCPQLRCFAVRQPLPQRQGNLVGDELELLLGYVDQLADDGLSTADYFVHPLRPGFRRFDRSRHHLREMTAFALGGAGALLRPLPSLAELCRPLPGGTPMVPATAHRSPGGQRVVVQLDAGWPLKGYPADRRGELLSRLRDGGYEPVLLGPSEPSAPTVAAHPYRDLAGFCALLDGAIAFIGCDSFPSHFAHQLGVPTVALFGNTRPSNARGLDSPHYRLLHHPMSCVPCREPSRCALDQGTSCHALPTASEVLLALQALVPIGPAPAMES